MNSLKRNKRPLYLCKKNIDTETNVTKFKEPKKIKINWQPIDTSSEVLMLGYEYSQYIRIKATARECSKFSNKDRCYIYKEPNFEKFDVMCNDADYEVDGNPIITLNEGEVMLKKLSGADE